MRGQIRVLAGALIIGLAAQAAQAEDLTSGRTQIGRGTSARVGFDRNAQNAGVPTFDPSKKGPAVAGQPNADLPAADVAILANALQHIRDLNKLGFRSNDTILAGDPNRLPNPIPGLTPDEVRVLGIFGVPNAAMSYTKAGGGIILPSVHRTLYYAFDIDRILANEYTIHAGGAFGADYPDIDIPVKPVQYERVVSTAVDNGLVGGWNSGATTTNPDGTVPAHYRVALPQYAVKKDGSLAYFTNPKGKTELAALQLLGPGNWYDTRPEDLPPQYNYDPQTEKFKVAMHLNTPSSPNLFPGGGHIACYWIYDFGNPPNCHAVARSGDPSAIGSGKGGYDSPNSGYGQYGTTIVQSIDNSGASN